MKGPVSSYFTRVPSEKLIWKMSSFKNTIILKLLGQEKKETLLIDFFVIFHQLMLLED